MSLLNILRSGVKIADKVTKSAQTSLLYARCTNPNTDGKGTPSFATAVALLGVMEQKVRSLPTDTGLLRTSTVTITFLDVAALATVTAGAGIKIDDKLTLPDGTSPPIKNVGGFTDAGTGQPIATEVYL